MSTRTTLITPTKINTIVRGIGRQGPAGDGVDWQEIYARTTDPGIAGEPWNNGGFLVFSNGPLSSTWVIVSGSWTDTGVWDDLQVWSDS